MTAAVKTAIDLTGPGFTARLLHRQRVHVGAQAEATLTAADG
jgi:hypothetical protein